MAGGPVGALAGAVAADLFTYGRTLGVDKINELVVAAMLDPALAARLLRKVPANPQGEKLAVRVIAQNLKKLGIVAAVPEEEEEPNSAGR